MTSDVVKNEVLMIENRLFVGKLLGSAIGYALVTLGLNSIRDTASLWIIWPLIIIQFLLYFSIFVTGYNRSKALGFNSGLAFVAFVLFAVLGRVNDWELFIIPLVVVVTALLSVRNRKVSKENEHLLSGTESFKGKSEVNTTVQRLLAKDLYQTNQDLAFLIALGKEKSPYKGLLASAVYAVVCDEVEKSNDVDISMKIANSWDNAELSAESQRLNLRSADRPIEAMKEVVNARREAFERTLPKGKTTKDVIDEEVQKMKKEMGAAQTEE